MSMARYFWIFAICPLFTPAFGAPKVIAKDRAAITQCLDHDKDGKTCIGIVFDSCYTPDSDIDDAKACAGRELAVWSEFLRDSLKNLNASSPPDVRAVVAESQSTWLKSRELLCSLFDKVDPGMYIGGSDYCRLQEVSRRYLILERLAEAVSEH